MDLSGVEAVRFKTVIVGDYPPGNEAQRRKTYAIRAPDHGSEARFLTIIEPYADRPLVKSAEALSADKLRVELTDGRVQEIAIENLAGSGRDITVRLTDSKNGRAIGTETTSAPVP